MNTAGEDLVVNNRLYIQKHVFQNPLLFYNKLLPLYGKKDGVATSFMKQHRSQTMKFLANLSPFRNIAKPSVWAGMILVVIGGASHSLLAQPEASGAAIMAI